MSYDDGMDALADAYVEMVGADAADVFLKLAQAGGEMAGRYSQQRADSAAAVEARKQAVKVGDAAWARMKRAAEAAKWPPDISPRVVLADKTWQSVKNTGAPEAMKAAVEAMNALATEIEMRLGMGGAPGMVPYTPPSSGLSNGVKFVLGALVTSVVGFIGYKALTKKR